MNAVFFSPKVALAPNMSTFVCMIPAQGGSKSVSPLTRGSCSHRWFRGEGGFTWSSCAESGQPALSAADLLSYNNNQNPQPAKTGESTKNPRPAPQISGAGASGWWLPPWKSSGFIRRAPLHIWPELLQALHPVKAQLLWELFCFYRGV